MDGAKFDDIVRRALSDASRRRVLRAGLGSLAAAGLTVFALRLAPDVDAETEARKRQRRKRRRQKKKNRQRRALTPPPPPPPPPPICPGQVSCPPDRCCDQCCLPIEGTDDAGRCAGPADEEKCCAEADGGGFCDTGEKCCPPGTIAELGSCGPSGATCCKASGENNGGWRNPDFDVCCPAGSVTYNCPTHISVCCDQSVVGPDGGCCSDDFPECCSPDEGLGCCPMNTRCCPSNQGAGCCPLAEPQCCGPNDKAGCCPDTSVCCAADREADCCPAATPVCCAPEDGAACCAENTVCCDASAGPDCCHEDTPICCPAGFPATCCAAETECCEVDLDCGDPPAMCDGGCCTGPGFAAARFGAGKPVAGGEAIAGRKARAGRPQAQGSNGRHKSIT